MLTVRGFEQTKKKLSRFADTLYARLFTPVGEAENLRLYETKVPLHEIPDDSLFAPVSGREQWGGEGV
ncbi:MAG: hypothetical protein IIX93_08900, partial [Clostridia bacterium]|nr:hypothetical protein [Clostridia bacterium]MBQ1257376.1 hypothetical protein [Clostridia bacterium]